MPRLSNRRLRRRTIASLLGWLSSGPLAGFNSLVVLATVAVVADLFGDAFPLWVKVVIVVATIVLSGLTFYVQYYRPSLVSAEEQRARIIEDYILESLLHRLEGLLGTGVVVRCNVMLMDRNLVGFPRHLRIEYCSQGRLGYSGIELAQAWRMGEGCCGWAYELKEQTFFDAATRQAALKDMTSEQVEATGHIGSILSTPIFQVDRDPRLEYPIGVLNLDSREPISRTCFDDPTVQDITAGYASVIGALL